MQISIVILIFLLSKDKILAGAKVSEGMANDLRGTPPPPIEESQCTDNWRKSMARVAH